MIIAYTGLDGSGKTYHMAEVCQRMLAQGFDCFGSTPFAGARLLENHRQLIRIEKAHIFFDEWHQDHDAKEWYNLDPILRHIVTQHRKYKLVIHWSAQHFMFMDPYIRRETTFVWDHEALFRDPDSGISRIQFKIPYIGEVKGMHRAKKYAAWEIELKRRRPTVIEKKTFFIVPSVYNSYDSYKKIMLSAKHVSDADINAITDPYQTEKIDDPHQLAASIIHKRALVAAANPSEDEECDLIAKQNALDGDNETQNNIELIERKNDADDLSASMEIRNPIENSGRQRLRRRQKTDEQAHQA